MDGWEVQSPLRQLNRLFFSEFSFVVVNTDTHWLGLRSLKELSAGDVRLKDNHLLCYSKAMNWSYLFRDKKQKVVQTPLVDVCGESRIFLCRPGRWQKHKNTHVLQHSSREEESNLRPAVLEPRLLGSGLQHVSDLPVLQPRAALCGALQPAAGVRALLFWKI